MRNCQRHPELIQIGRPPCWVPRAEIADKKAEVTGFRNSECPTSYITPQSIWMLELTTANEVIQRSGGGGATMFGPDASKWPAWWVDAVVAIGSAEAAWNAAEREALKKK